jgi:Leucine-rich repeat (LRR) protein
MNFDPQLPDAACQVLARFGAQIEYTENEPNGIVDLTSSEVADEDLRPLVVYPGFDALVLDKTEISDVGLKFIGEMSNLESVGLYDTSISDEGLEHLPGLSKLERLNIACDPG